MNEMQKATHEIASETQRLLDESDVPLAVSDVHDYDFAVPLPSRLDALHDFAVSILERESQKIRVIVYIAEEPHNPST